MKHQFIGFIITAALLGNCSKKSATTAELEVFVDDPRNSLIQSRTKDGVLVEVKFQPSSLLAAREIQNEKKTARQHDSICSKYNSYYSFLLTFSRDNKELITQNASFSNYSQLIQVLSFKMSQYVSLTNSMGDTLRPITCLFDRTYGLDTKSRLLVVFPKKDENDDLYLTIEEFGLNCGDVRFHLDVNAMRQVSDINLYFIK